MQMGSSVRVRAVQEFCMWTRLGTAQELAKSGLRGVDAVGMGLGAPADMPCCAGCTAHRMQLLKFPKTLKPPRRRRRRPGRRFTPRC